MSNFDFLLAEKDFDCFSNIAISAEKLFLIDPESSVIKCRKAMEIAIKWMYSIDRDLKKPIWDDKLVSLMNEQSFKDIVPPDLYKRLDYIRLLGNSAVHSVKERERIKPEAALLCLENLHSFMDFIAYCYARFDYDQTVFDPALISNNQSAVSEKESKETELEEKLQALLKENEALKSELTAKREEQQQTYVAKPLDISEFETRRLYIDVMLERAGWRKKKNCIEEYDVYGMPNQSGKGYVDYALLGDDNKVLAIVEAKKTCKDLAAARQQAEIYANLIEKVQGRKPVIFLTNGFETRIIDGCYPERRISEIYSKRDLEKLFNLRITKQDLRQAKVNSKIANRYYQKEAIIATCDVLSSNRRKALLVMATGSGKTRTVIALCDILLNNGWVKNILFLADRTALVNQAKNNFVALMPNLSVVNLCDDKENYTARCVFSTYNTMMNCIDTAQDDEGRLFTSGHFDLIICDEAHRSIYNKYKDIFDYFDAPLVGLTATPKDEIDKNTYSVFDLQSGMPTYAYELKQAVKDGFLVDYKYADTKLKFLEEGIKYDDLSPEEQEEFEKTFVNEDGEAIREIDSSALNSWVFNKDTIRQVLDILMNKGHRVDYGNKLGKTIIFAKNHNHAEEIFKVFNEEYPHLNGYAEVIDNYSKKPDLAIEQFKIGKKLPQIAISVDMLDTGIDVPEVVNLVFFKKVRSKAKFHQMIGRGTRLCPGLFDGKDKENFYIFDFCSNFDFFSGDKPVETPVFLPIQGALFKIKFEMAHKLQEIAYQTPELIDFRKRIVNEMLTKVKELNRNNFSVRNHLEWVERYSDINSYTNITFEQTLNVQKELAFLIEPENDDAEALRFDSLLYGIEFANLCRTRNALSLRYLKQKTQALSKIANIPEINKHSELINKIIHTSFVENATFNDFEKIRKELRDLMKYIEPVEPRHPPCEIDFEEQVINTEWAVRENDEDQFVDYKARARYFVLAHKDNPSIAKLNGNLPLNSEDVEELEKILWSELGTEDDYRNNYGQTNLGEFVRSIVGLDMKAAKEAFSEFLDETKLDSNQIYFVNQIVEYIVQNGMIKDMRVLQGAPFNAHGSIIDLFKDLTIWQGIVKVIQKVNDNAKVAS